jgi:glutamyl-tRNA synthetase
MSIEEESFQLKQIIRKYALKNAYDYGKALSSKIIGKIISEYPKAKEDMKSILNLVEQQVQQVNSMSLKEIEQELSNFSFEEKKKEEKKQLTLPNAKENQVITRFPPEPSGYLHIGHAKAAWLDFQAAKTYKGKMILRFDDTNPEKEKQEYVDSIKKDLLWLGIDWDIESYTSDRMEELYTYCDEMFVKFSAYVCTCPQEKIKKDREAKVECDCRARDPQENMILFRKMKEGKMEEGGAIVRFKGNMKSENTVLRDPTLFRIIKKEHYRQGNKYFCWPSYDFAAPIMDSLEGVTHAMRTKEYELRNELYFAILKILELRQPILIEFSRLSIKNAPISKRLITPLISEGKVEGWDDPRLPTLSALRRRGFQPQAIKEFVLSFGLTKVEAEPTWEKLYFENRKILSETALRRYFVKDPVKLKIIGANKTYATIKNHPNKEDFGTRIIPVSDEFYISFQDANSLKIGEIFRLKELYNVKLIEKSDHLIANFEAEEGEVDKKIQWVPCENKLNCQVIVPGNLLDESGNFNKESKKIDSGFCEPSCKDLPEGAVIQFERYAFVRLDKKSDEGLVFIFTC